MFDDVRTLPSGPRKVSAHRFGNYLKTAVLMAGLTALVLAFGQSLGGPQGLLYSGVFVVLMNFGMFWFSDRIALALNGARPIPEGELPWLRQMVEQLTRRANMPMPKLYFVPSPMPNAFATGRSPSHAAVAVTDGILRILDRRELMGVLAHELAHVQNRDTLISTIAATMAGLITQVARMAFWFGGMFMGGNRDRDEEGHGSALASIGMLIVAPIAAMLLQLAISRSREFGADASGAALCEDPDALADALEKLEHGAQAVPYEGSPATASLYIVNPLTGGGLMRLFSTHPATEDRVRKLREMARGSLTR